VAFAKSPSWQIDSSLLASRYFDKFLQQFLVVSLDLGLLGYTKDKKYDD